MYDMLLFLSVLNLQAFNKSKEIFYIVIKAGKREREKKVHQFQEKEIQKNEHVLIICI